MVRAANPQARTIVITGHRSEMDEVIERMMAEGADAVCYKPFNVSELLDKLEQLSGLELRQVAAFQEMIEQGLRRCHGSTLQEIAHEARSFGREHALRVKLHALDRQ